MKHVSIFVYFILILIVIFVPENIQAQLHDYGAKFGLQFNGAIPTTEFWESNGLKGSYVARAYNRFELHTLLQIEIGAGYGSLAGLDYDLNYYRTEIIPVDIRFLLNFMENERWNPYVYAGAGILDFKVTDLPISVSPKEVKKDGFTGFIPAGIGLEIALSDNIIIDLNGGVNYSFTDDLNYYKLGEPKDAYYTAGIGFAFVSGGGDADPDLDGLTNKEEKQAGTDSKNPDTDSDGLKDGEEIHTYRTNPLNADTDGDGLKDGEEITIYKTDPMKTDTDNDGLKDGEEVLKHKTDALKTDTDSDTLDDGQEVIKYKTNPLKIDTDEDGLNDGFEILKYSTDPLVVDTDSDGLNDGAEVNQYKTDPLRPDTDGGTVNDGTEIANGTNPLDSIDDVPKEDEVRVEIGVPIVLEGIFFKTGSAQITPESEEVLTKAFNTLDRHPEVEVEVQGHTDNVGKHDYNMKLSQKRADAVKTWLVNRGIIETRITTKGFGPEKPLEPNTTPDGRQKNRRIEFLRLK